MPYVTPENIKLAKQVDLLSYLQSCEPMELVRFSRDTYTTRTHDSIKISNGKWYWWSQGIGGRSALDYLIKVNGLSFTEAVETLAGKSISIGQKEPEQSKPKPNRLLLPHRHSNNDKVIKYLCSRGIDFEIVQYCIDNGYIFESQPCHNAVFVGMDGFGTPRYAAYHGTGTKRFLGDADGSDKHFSFRLASNISDTVHIFECATDLLSYATILKMNGEDWRNENLLSLAGVYQPQKDITKSKVPKALEGFLNDHPVKRVVFHLDNDPIGRKATEAISMVLPDKYEKVNEPPPKGKDFNDYLCICLGWPIYQNYGKGESRDER